MLRGGSFHSAPSAVKKSDGSDSSYLMSASLLSSQHVGGCSALCDLAHEITALLISRTADLSHHSWCRPGDRPSQLRVVCEWPDEGLFNVRRVGKYRLLVASTPQFIPTCTLAVASGGLVLVSEGIILRRADRAKDTASNGC
jgi:hypothetical protein